MFASSTQRRSSTRTRGAGRSFPLRLALLLAVEVDIQMLETCLRPILGLQCWMLLNLKGIEPATILTIAKFTFYLPEVRIIKPYERSNAAYTGFHRSAIPRLQASSTQETRTTSTSMSLRIARSLPRSMLEQFRQMHRASITPLRRRSPHRTLCSRHLRRRTRTHTSLVAKHIVRRR